MSTRLGEALLSEKAVAALATPANLRLGREIVAAGGVELVELSPPHAVAEVTGGQRRTVGLEAVDGKLRFACTCTTKRPDFFCKHCVAAAIVIKPGLA